MLDRLTAKQEIVNGSLLKFSEKIGFVNSKSAESISKYALSADTINTIEEGTSNALKQLTGVGENEFYVGEWTVRNQ